MITYDGEFKNPNIEHRVSDYVKWVKRELENCRKYLSGTDSAKRIDIPYIENGNISREGYKGGDFCLTMEQDKVLQLLTGKNLYSDAGVFVRELLQNSIDAVHTRRGLDARFREEDGKICIRTWTDNEGYSWFRIEDNGIGMDENIITNYLLKIGKSYYTSDDFKKLKENFYDKSYTPISRFGIGILSCFMSDPNTTVAISTRRYVSGKNPPPIRMDITGLHGYYYFTDETVSPEFKPMPHPDDETDKQLSQTEKEGVHQVHALHPTVFGEAEHVLPGEFAVSLFFHRVPQKIGAGVLHPHLLLYTYCRGWLI